MLVSACSEHHASAFHCKLQEQADVCRSFNCKYSKAASLAENLAFLREVLQELGRGHKIVVFVLDEFDLFAKKAKQTTLYNLLDAMQSAGMQVGHQPSASQHCKALYISQCCLLPHTVGSVQSQLACWLLCIVQATSEAAHCHSYDFEPVQTCHTWHYNLHSMDVQCLLSRIIVNPWLLLYVSATYLWQQTWHPLTDNTQQNLTLMELISVNSRLSSVKITHHCHSTKPTINSIKQLLLMAEARLLICSVKTYLALSCISS